MIYVASSWGNPRQPGIVQALRAAGHEVYDFRAHGDFHWSDIDPAWESWTAEEVVVALKHPIAQRSFACDMQALEACDALVLVMPCGRSAHLELGYAIGAGKRTAILLEDGEPELMWAAADWIGADLGDLIAWLEAEDRTLGVRDPERCDNCGQVGGHEETCPAPREEQLEEAAAIYHATRPTTAELLQRLRPGDKLTIDVRQPPGVCMCRTQAGARIPAVTKATLDEWSEIRPKVEAHHDPDVAIRSVLIQLPRPRPRGALLDTQADDILLDAWQRALDGELVRLELGGPIPPRMRHQLQQLIMAAGDVVSVAANGTAYAFPGDGRLELVET